MFCVGFLFVWCGGGGFVSLFVFFLSPPPPPLDLLVNLKFPFSTLSIVL